MVQLKLTDSTSAPAPVLEQGHSPTRTAFHRFGDQSVGRGFVAMCDRRYYLHHTRPTVLEDQLHKANQEVIVESADEFAPLGKGLVIAAQRLQIFCEVFKRPPLSQR